MLAAQSSQTPPVAFTPATPCLRLLLPLSPPRRPPLLLLLAPIHRAGAERRRSDRSEGRGRRREESAARNREINAEIMAAHDAAALWAVIEDQHPAFNAVNAFTAYRQLLRRGTRACDAAVALAEAQVVRHVAAAGPRECANVLHALATSGHAPRLDILPAIEARMQQLGRNAFNPQDIANTLWAYATMERTPGQALWTVLEHQVTQHSHLFTPQNLANTLWAYGVQGQLPAAGTLAALETQVEARAGDLNAQEVANILLATAKLSRLDQPGCNREAMLCALEQRGLEIVASFKAQEAANVLWALATLQKRAGGELWVALESLSYNMARSLSPQNVANILWAFATSGKRPSAGMLCALQERAEETGNFFKAQDVANTLWAHATIGKQPGERLLKVLEARAVEIAHCFNPQNIANTLWAYAAWERRPRAESMRALCAQAEHEAASFSAQNIANTLRAFAILAFPPGDGLLGALASRAAEVECEFKTMEVASLLWSACYLCIDAPALTCRFVNGLEEAVCRLRHADDLDDASLSQLHMFFLACQLEEGLACGLSRPVLSVGETIGGVAREAFAAQGARPSHTQHQVSAALRSMHLCVQDEFRCPQSALSLDHVVANESSRPWHWAIEVDGPQHFLACRSATGGTIVKRRLVRRLGYSLVSIPYWEWDALPEPGQRVEYLRGLLHVHKRSPSTCA